MGSMSVVNRLAEWKRKSPVPCLMDFDIMDNGRVRVSMCDESGRCVSRIRDTLDEALTAALDYWESSDLSSLEHDDSLPVMRSLGETEIMATPTGVSRA